MIYLWTEVVSEVFNFEKLPENVQNIHSKAQVLESILMKLKAAGQQRYLKKGLVEVIFYEFCELFCRTPVNGYCCFILYFLAEAYSETWKTSKMERFAKTVKLQLFSQNALLRCFAGFW